MIACAGHPKRKAEYEVYTGSYWQPHCESCAKEAMDCEQGALIRGLGYATESKDRRQE